MSFALVNSRYLIIIITHELCYQMLLIDLIMKPTACGKGNVGFPSFMGNLILLSRRWIIAYVILV